MAKNPAKNTITDIGEVERTLNYIQFQISQADELLVPYANSDLPPIQFAHLLSWKKQLQNELHSVRKAQRESRERNQ